MYQRVPKGSTATLVTYAVPYTGGEPILAAPSAASVRIDTPSGIGSFAAATVDSATSSLSATDEGEVSLTVTSQTWVRGRAYLVKCATREAFVVRSAKSGASTTLRLTQPLPMAIPASSNIYSLAITRALTTTETSVEGEGVAHWKATIGGIEYAWSETFRIVRRVPTWWLDSESLTRLLPLAVNMRERDDEDYTETIEAALNNELLPRLRAKGIREEDVVTTDPLTPCHVAAVALHLAKNDPSTPLDRREAAERDLVQSLDLAMADVGAWYDAPQTEDPTPGVERVPHTTMWVTR